MALCRTPHAFVARKRRSACERHLRGPGAPGASRKEGGGLFGGGQKIVEYRYFANFAVASGEGPAGGVLRIWAGDKLIADLREGAGAYANHPKYNFRIYRGRVDDCLGATTALALRGGDHDRSFM